MRLEWWIIWGWWLAANAWLVSGQVALTEFQTANTTTLRDEDGDSEDWIEIANLSEATVNLEGWSLTDDPQRPDKWKFPSTNLTSGQYLVVFASSKDRRVPGRPLHTNFKLNVEGEYLALYRPGARTIATDYAPAYPPQANDLSYGLPMKARTLALLGAGAQAKAWIPDVSSASNPWTLSEFDDSTWQTVSTGVGFDERIEAGIPTWTNLIRSPIGDRMRGINASLYLRLPFVIENGAILDQLLLRIRYNDGFVACLNGTPVVARNAPMAAEGGVQADSLADWSAIGQQGFQNWYYGFYDQSADSDGIYDPLVDFNNLDSRWTWNGGAWVLGPSNPPWDTIGATSWHPNGSNSGGAHWVIRRWVSETSGSVTCRLDFAKENLGCGNGTTLRVLLNGQQRFQHTVAFNDSAGISTHLILAGIQEGDFLDFVLDPRGADGQTQDGCDGSTFSVVIEQSPSEGASWNSAALASRSREQSALPEDIDLTRYRDLLEVGTNLLAIQGLNVSADDSDFLLLPELLSARPELDTNQPAYFARPTPGAPNDPGSLTVGPIISQVRHLPSLPSPGGDLGVRARVTPSFLPVDRVQLRYRVMFGPELAVDLYDDGLHGDEGPDDSIYGARLPASALSAGKMIRYSVVATDSQGRQTRAPANPVSNQGPQYYGTVVDDPALASSSLPVLQWFVENPRAVDSGGTTRCSLFYQGEFYDNLLLTLHGQSTRGFPKKSYDIDFHPGHRFRWSDSAPRVDNLNLLTTWADKTHLRTPLAYDTYRDAGGPSHFAFGVRVQQNGSFFSVANLVENGDKHYLDRLGLDPNGAFYKMYNSAESPSSAEKKTRKHEGFADLKALIDGMSQANIPARQAYMYDHLDLPEMINFLAAKMITADTDCCHKNYYLYRDTEGTEEWQAMPWDVDLSFGRNWTCGSPCLNYFDETLYTNQSIYVGRGNRVFSPLYDTPATRQMFLRRLRTLMDTMLQPPGTPASADAYRQKILALREQFAPDAALDLAKWGTWGRQETIYLATDRMFNEFFPGRRAYLFRTLSETNRGDIPSAQRTNVLVQFSALEYRPASGNPREEWLSISNANPEAVDISGWRLEGGVRFRFKPGTIIPSRSAIYVSPDVKAFRARAASPKGGERLLVVGPYEGNLSAWGESLNLVDSDGRLVSSHHYTGSPSPAQQYLRITEIHYHPRAWPEDPLADPEEFEFIELRNIGPIALDLRGIRLTEGIAFDFTSGTLAQLAAGARILVVANTHLFAAAYGSGLPIAGQFNGSLDNGGERLRLEDEFGEKILDFEYGDEWHPATDGQGFSLEIIDETGSWSAWGDPARWRPSTIANGTPGRGDAAPSLLRLSQPTDGAVLPAGSSLEIAVQTESPVDPIDRVRLFADDRPLAELLAAPFAMTWSGAPAGLHTLMAVGNHRSGLLSTSAVVTVALATVTNILFDLVPAGAPWKYQDNGSSPSASWTAIDFEDASWKSGIAELGYGDDADGRPETTRIDYGPNPSEKYATCHFRHGFVLEAMLDPQELELNLLRDDGAVVYLNGAEVFRSNMPDGAINDLSLASSAVSGADETRFFTQSLSSSQLRKGENVIAVEVHQSSRSSSDLSFDLSLRGRRPVILPVILRQPGNQVIPEGSPLALAVWAGGTGPLRYQWQFEGVSIAGATNSTFTIASVTSDQWGVYTVVVSNEAGSLSSQPFRVSSGTQPPVPGPDGLLVPQSTAVTMAVDSLLENDADPDGDGLSLTRVDPTSSQGASLVLASGWVTYTPPPGFQGQDSFNYIVHDTKNLSATGRVDVLVYDGLLPVLHQLRLDPVAGIYRLRYTGTPARILELQRSTDLVHWSILQQTPIPPHGVVEYLELHPPVGEAYYRAVEK